LQRTKFKLCKTHLMADPEDELVRLIIDLKESLQREIQGLEGETRSLTREVREGFAQLNARFDTQAARLDKLEGLSSRWPLS
jgi:hypothetical protein